MTCAPRRRSCRDDELDALDVVDMLGQLVDKSLVVVDDDDGGGALPPARDDPPVRPGTTRSQRRPGALRRRHADHYVALAEAAGPQPAGPRATRVGARQSRARSTTSAPRSTGPSRHRRRSTRCAWSRRWRCIPSPSGMRRRPGPKLPSRFPTRVEHRLYPDVASWATEAAIARGDLASAEQYAAAIGNAEARLGEVSATAFSGLAKVAMFRGDFLDARTKNEECVTRSRRGGDAYELSQALMRLSLNRRRPVARRWPGRARKRPCRSPAPPESPPRWQHPSS